MIPGRVTKRVKRFFRKPRWCEVVGCSRRARHVWYYPCAVNTMAADPTTERWLALCDPCDVEMNRRLLEVVGVPFHVLEEIIAAYELIQGDIAMEAK